LKGNGFAMKKGPNRTKGPGRAAGGSSGASQSSGTTERRRRARTVSGKDGLRRSTKAAKGHAASSNVIREQPERQSGRTRGAASVDPDSCYHCAKNLSGENERALFVEEEVGRIFCSESCIAAYFTPEIERLEKEFFRRLTPSDLTSEERENLAHLRWITLQEPDEVWREKTLTGDYRYTLISEFKPGAKKIWSICICLFLRGEPSFLYLAFPTKNAAMANQYRRGEQVEWVRPHPQHEQQQTGASEEAAQEAGGDTKEEKLDCLADSWTEDETVLAQLNKGRSKDDIPPSDYGLYQACLEDTLETPDEVWSHESQAEEPIKLYHFIKQYPDEQPGVWFVIVARETDDEEQIEIIDAFPTRDPQLVEHYRRGEQEVGQIDARSAARVVH
jgi:hypothetical protein